MGLSVLGPKERRGTPSFGGGIEHKKLMQLVLQYDDETEKLMKENPNLVIVGNRPDREKILSLYFPNGNYNDWKPSDDE